MNAPSKISGTKAKRAKISRASRLFTLNRSQALRIPKDFAFPEGVEEVVFRRSGNSLVITPKNSFWDDFFAEGANRDFPERFPQGDYETREEF